MKLKDLITEVKEREKNFNEFKSAINRLSKNYRIDSKEFSSGGIKIISATVYWKPTERSELMVLVVNFYGDNINFDYYYGFDKYPPFKFFNSNHTKTYMKWYELENKEGDSVPAYEFPFHKKPAKISEKELMSFLKYMDGEKRPKVQDKYLKK